MMAHTIACVVGARPNFVKIGPILAGLRAVAPRVRPVLVHTGQHYDDRMSRDFFDELGLPDPDVHLAVGPAPPGEQTARILAGFDEWLNRCKPRPAATLVVGDVNSTLACALASVKAQVPVVHVEAGLRSFDRSMPEEINRVVTDAVAELLLVSEPSGLGNLRAEGRPESAIRLTGNVMVDVLRRQLPAARELNQPESMGVTAHNYAVWTMHRPSTVDDLWILGRMASALERLACRLPVVFPVHPRTQHQLEAAGLWRRLASSSRVKLSPPLGYVEFLSLTSRAQLIITDSGGLQEEATALEIPCLTLRGNTERPITVTEGTSTLVGHDFDLLERHADDVLAGRYKQGRCPAIWDGRSGERVAREVARFLDRLRPIPSQGTARRKAPAVCVGSPGLRELFGSEPSHPR